MISLVCNIYSYSLLEDTCWITKSSEPIHRLIQKRCWVGRTKMWHLNFSLQKILFPRLTPLLRTLLQFGAYTTGIQVHRISSKLTEGTAKNWKYDLWKKIIYMKWEVSLSLSSSLTYSLNLWKQGPKHKIN